MHKTCLNKSFELAQQARDKGNEPFGACLVRNGEIILCAENTVHTEGDSTGHAETNLVKKAVQSFPTSVLKESILYTSTEPCAMCAGAIYWAGIPTVVFGCSNQSLCQIAGPGLSVSCREIFSKGTKEIEVIGPMMEDEAIKVHEGFWQENPR